MSEESPKSNRRGILTVIVVFGGMFLMFFVFAAIVIAAMGEGGLTGISGDKIGIVEVDGPIMSSKTIVQNLKRFEKDDSIKGIVVRIDSPGGAVAPSQEIFEALKRTREKKPLAVSMGNTAASGGYYIAVGSNQIFANAGSVTGSIGVITQFVNVSRLVDRTDVEFHTLKTGPYKDSGSPVREFDLKDELYVRQLIEDIYDQFLEDIVVQRDIEMEELRELADGRVFTGRQAKDLKLIDEIGTLHDAVQWVAREANIEEDEPNVVYPPDDDTFISKLLKEGVDTTVSEVRSASTPIVEYRYVGPQ